MSKRFHTGTHVQKRRRRGSGEGAQVGFLQTNVGAQTLFGVSTVLDHITGRRRRGGAGARGPRQHENRN